MPTVTCSARHPPSAAMRASPDTAAPCSRSPAAASVLIRQLAAQWQSRTIVSCSPQTLARTRASIPNMHDETIDYPKSEFTQLAELVTQSHQDAVNPAHDAIDVMHHTGAQDIHHFLV